MRWIVATAVALAVLAAPAVAASSAVRVSPQRINFGTKAVGTTTFKTVSVTNTGSADVLVAMTGGLPDDYGWGPVDIERDRCVFSGGDVLAPGESCNAFVRFSPSEFFAGWRQDGTLQVTVSDPTTLAVLETTVVSITGIGR
jgi:hypothetical protein